MATSYSDNVNVDYLLEKRDTQPPLQVTRDQAKVKSNKSTSCKCATKCDGTSYKTKC